MPIIDASGLMYTYSAPGEEVRALRGVDLTVAAGEFAGQPLGRVPFGCRTTSGSRPWARATPTATSRSWTPSFR